MALTRKFALFDLDEGGFLTADGKHVEGKNEYD